MLLLFLLSYGLYLLQQFVLLTFFSALWYNRDFLALLHATSEPSSSTRSLHVDPEDYCVPNCLRHVSCLSWMWRGGHRMLIVSYLKGALGLKQTLGAVLSSISFWSQFEGSALVILNLFIQLRVPRPSSISVTWSTVYSDLLLGHRGVMFSTSRCSCTVTYCHVTSPLCLYQRTWPLVFWESWKYLFGILHHQLCLSLRPFSPLLRL